MISEDSVIGELETRDRSEDFRKADEELLAKKNLSENRLSSVPPLEKIEENSLETKNEPFPFTRKSNLRSSKKRKNKLDHHYPRKNAPSPSKPNPNSLTAREYQQWFPKRTGIHHIFWKKSGVQKVVEKFKYLVSFCVFF